MGCLTNKLTPIVITLICAIVRNQIYDCSPYTLFFSGCSSRLCSLGRLSLLMPFAMPCDGQCSLCILWYGALVYSQLTDGWKTSRWWCSIYHDKRVNSNYAPSRHLCFMRCLFATRWHCIQRKVTFRRSIKGLWVPSHRCRTNVLSTPGSQLGIGETNFSVDRNSTKRRIILRKWQKIKDSAYAWQAK